MSIYTKPAVTPAWGESNTTVADMVQPTDPEVKAGWPVSATPPSRQRFNWIFNFVANAVRYFMQRGLVDYDAAETYNSSARIIGDDGRTYASLVDDNIGNTPSTNPAKWQRWGFTVADLINFAFANPTANTQPTADSTTKVATTAFVNNRFQLGFAIQLGGNGYIKFPSLLGGFMIQWMVGQEDPTTGGDAGQVNYVTNWPTQFPNACLFAQVGTAVAGPTTFVDVWYQLISFDQFTCGVQRQISSGAPSFNRTTHATFIGIGY